MEQTSGYQTSEGLRAHERKSYDAFTNIAYFLLLIFSYFSNKSAHFCF